MTTPYYPSTTRRPLITGPPIRPLQSSVTTIPLGTITLLLLQIPLTLFLICIVILWQGILRELLIHQGLQIVIHRNILHSRTHFYLTFRRCPLLVGRFLSTERRVCAEDVRVRTELRRAEGSMR